MSELQAFVLSPVGAIASYLALGVLTIVAGRAADAVLARRKPD